MNKWCRLIVACVFVLASSQLGAVELLINGDLELAGGGPPGWTLSEFPSMGTGNFDTAQQIGFADVDGGVDEFGIWLKPFAGGVDPPGRLVNAVLSQTVPATAGEGYSFSGWSRWEINYAGGVNTLDAGSPFGGIPSPTRTEMELAFLNSDGGVIGNHVLDLRTVQNNFDFWVQHNFDELLGGGSPLVAPEGAASVRISASMLDGAYNTNPQQSAFFDDFSLVAAGTPGMELLTNADLDMRPPEFEGWTVIEDPDGVDTVNAQMATWAQNENTSGATGAFLHPWANGGLVSDPNDAIFQQTVAGVAGGEFTFSMWTKFEGNYAGGVDTLNSGSPNGAVESPTETMMELAFLNTSGTEIGMPEMLDLRADREMQSGGSANDSAWRQHTLSAVAPAGTETVRVTGAMIDGVFNEDPGQSAFFDDFSLDGPASGVVDGDFNSDGNWDCADINALTGAIASGSMDLAFDMNGDGTISQADVTDANVGWLAVGGVNNPADTGGNPFLPGDANLSGAVDVSDFNVWNGSKFTAVDAWCLGDFNADGSADVSDFNIWNGSKFTSSSGVAAVPEPASGLIMAILVLAAAVAAGPRRNKNCQVGLLSARRNS